jgi:Holliday junction resolvase RusA-like endonuclease
MKNDHPFADTQKQETPLETLASILEMKFEDTAVKQVSINVVKSILPRQIIYGNIPSKSNCYKIITFKTKDSSKAGHASLAKTPALAKYEKDFYIQCNHYRDKMIDGYLQIEVDVYYPSQRSDLDNSLKVLLDCLQKVKAFSNDNKVTRILANKFLDARNPRIEFVIKQSM